MYYAYKTSRGVGRNFIGGSKRVEAKQQGVWGEHNPLDTE